MPRVPLPTEHHAIHVFAMIDDFFDGDRAKTLDLCRKLAGQVLVIPKSEIVEELATAKAIVTAVDRDPSTPNLFRLSGLFGIPRKQLSSIYRRQTGRGVRAMIHATVPPELGPHHVQLTEARSLLGVSRHRFAQMVADGILPVGRKWNGKDRWSRAAIEQAVRRLAPWRDRINSPSGAAARRPIVCWETGQAFASESSAARWADTSHAAAARAVAAGTACNGFHFFDARKAEADRPPLQEGQAQIWVEAVNGPVFLEMNHAAEWVRGQGCTFSRQYICRSIRRGLPVHGVTFRRVPLEQRREVVHRIAGMRERGRPTAFSGPKQLRSRAGSERDTIAGSRRFASPPSPVHPTRQGQTPVRPERKLAEG
jgi:hypothetical protein